MSDESLRERPEDSDVEAEWDAKLEEGFAVEEDDYLDDESDTVDEGAAELSDEYEEIHSDEVDRVVEALEELYETVESENIQAYLEEAIDAIYYLVYDDEDEEADETTPDAA